MSILACLLSKSGMEKNYRFDSDSVILLSDGTTLRWKGKLGRRVIVYKDNCVKRQQMKCQKQILSVVRVYEKYNYC